MKYNNNYDILENNVVDAFRNSFDEYYKFFKQNSKLDFVKKLKEDTGFGLKEAKEQSDIVFDGGIAKFKIFNLRNQRRVKLDKLKTNLLVKELIDYIKDTNSDELYEIFSELDVEILELIVERFLDD